MNASKKIANKCFYTAIKSDFLLNSNNHLKYVQQVKEFIYYNPYWQKNLLIQNAEQYLLQLTPSEVINWSERYPPKTILCKNSYLNALQTLKISTHSVESKVCQLIKEIWQEHTQFNIQEEKALFDQFSRYISYKDHLIQIDNLLLQNQLNNMFYFFSCFKDMDEKK